MKLPNGEQAIVEIAKLRDYCLSETHPRGRHKARVFASALGMNEQHAEQLRDALLEAAREIEASIGEADEYGQRYNLDVTLAGPGGTATVRSCWIIRDGETIPRLTSCYVL